MKIRSLNLNDLAQLEGSQKGFPIPNITNPLYFIQVSMEDDDGELVGAALVHLTTEVSLLFKDGTSKMKKAKALVTLFTVLKQEVKKRGLEDTHVFLLEDNGTFRDLLEKKLKFVQATGTPMYYQIGD